MISKMVEMEVVLRAERWSVVPESLIVYVSLGMLYFVFK